jgi:hypothetical protein
VRRRTSPECEQIVASAGALLGPFGPGQAGGGETGYSRPPSSLHRLAGLEPLPLPEVNLVRLERSLAHQRVLGVPQGAGIIRTGVTVGGYAARGHNKSKGRRNEQPHLLNL